MIATSNHIKLEKLAAGRELEILEQVAGIPHEYLNKKGHPCPICGGKDRFSLIDEAKGTVFCRHCFNHGNRGYINAVIHYGQASDYKEARQMILEHLTGSQATQVTQATQKTVQKTVEKTKPQIVKAWIYFDETGKEVKKINRWEPGFLGASKSMTPEVFHNGKWVTRSYFKKNDSEWDKIWDSVAGLPLNLPNLMQQQDRAVYIVEGEKCFDQLNEWEFLATTGSGGTSTKTDWAKYLTGRDVVILPDNDEAGYKYALKTAQSLQNTAENIRIVFLPDLPEKGDIIDFVNAGGTREKFSNIVANTPTWDKQPFAYKNETKNDIEDQKNTEKEKSRVNLRSYSNIEELPVDWLLKDFIPLSMITLLVGEAGEGKSFLTTWLSSMVSTQGNIFRNDIIPRGEVIIGNSEDNPNRTIKPRLQMNGADMNHIYDVPTVMRNITTVNGKIEYEASITLDSIRDLREVLEQLPKCRLIIFDPISAFWGEVNENKNPQVRVVMEQLKRVAEDYQVAIVLVTHYNKGLGTQALARITGSLALAAACRSVWSVTNNKETNIRTVACVKMNLSENRAGFTFEITDGRINILDEYVDITADEMLQERMLNQQKRRGPEPEKMNECCDWLRGILAFGSVSASEIYEKSAAAGYSKRTVERAKKLLDIKPKKEYFSGCWMWSFPQDIQSNSDTKNNLAVFEDRQVISEISENLAVFEQSLENKGFENEKLSENSQDGQVSPVYKENLTTFGETAQFSQVSTTKANCADTKEMNCGKDKKSVAKSTNKTTAAHCGKTKDSDVVITTTVAEMEERVNQILKQRITQAISKKEQLEAAEKERMERINRQAEENLKKVDALLENAVIREDLQTEEMKKFRRAVGEK